MKYLLVLFFMLAAWFCWALAKAQNYERTLECNATFIIHSDKEDLRGLIFLKEYKPEEERAYFDCYFLNPEGVKEIELGKCRMHLQGEELIHWEVIHDEEY